MQCARRKVFTRDILAYHSAHYDGLSVKIVPVTFKIRRTANAKMLPVSILLSPSLARSRYSLHKPGMNFASRRCAGAFEHQVVACPLDDGVVSAVVGSRALLDRLDFVGVLLGYAVSGEPTLEALFERLLPFARPFVALFGRNQLLARSTLARGFRGEGQGPFVGNVTHNP